MVSSSKKAVATFLLQQNLQMQQFFSDNLFDYKVFAWLQRERKKITQSFQQKELLKVDEANAFQGVKKVDQPTVKSLGPREISTPLNFADAGFSSITPMKVSKCCGHKVLTLKGKNYFFKFNFKTYLKKIRRPRTSAISSLKHRTMAYKYIKFSKRCFVCPFPSTVAIAPHCLYLSRHLRPSHTLLFIMPPSFLSVNFLSSTLDHLPSPWNPTLPTSLS